MPDFTLTDQLNRPVRLSDFQGKVVAVDFIYTRCPLPDVCPRLSANFARLQTRFRERIGRELVLLSITIDPQYDTPGELLKYAKIWNAEEQGWRFLTGADGEIEIVMVFTTVPASHFRTSEVLEWYRVRWQIELVYKRLETLAELGSLPKHDDQSARAWLYGKLLIALLGQKLERLGRDISPWGYRIPEAWKWQRVAGF